MTPPIERIRYYDGEYLRAFDFTAEQDYHIEMRRRLNMALHLNGIVEGLQLQDTSDASTGISQVTVASGMAINYFGREIILVAPYTFDDVADVQSNRLQHSKVYEVWIQYNRVAATPPSTGYTTCNNTTQATRWLEGCKIVLLEKSTPILPSPPAVTDDISEDETPDPDNSNGVFLGYVNVTLGQTSGVFHYVDPTPNTVRYIGLRAQQIQPPDFPDSTPFNIINHNYPSLPPLGLDVQSNLFVDQNFIVGTDFPIDPNSIVPTPAPVPPAVFPSPTGNVKIAADMFLQGELYHKQQTTNQYMSLPAYIASFIPDIQTGIQSISINTNSTTGTATVVVNSTLPSPKTPKLLAAISGVIFNHAYTLAGNDVNFSVVPNYDVPSATLTLTCTVTPLQGSQPPITSLTVIWLAIFFPQ